MNETTDPASAIYRIALEPVNSRVAAVIDGVNIADSAGAVLSHETHLSPTPYFPRADIAAGVLQRGERRTFCPFKGTATHWSLRLPARTIENATWSYGRPLEHAVPITGYVAFYEGVIERWITEPGVLEGKAVAREAIADLPLADWIMRHAWFAKSARDCREQTELTGLCTI